MGALKVHQIIPQTLYHRGIFWRPAIIIRALPDEVDRCGQRAEIIPDFYVKIDPFIFHAFKPTAPTLKKY
jgi:hypothetical protein